MCPPLVYKAAQQLFGGPHPPDRQAFGRQPRLADSPLRLPLRGTPSPSVTSSAGAQYWNSTEDTPDVSDSVSCALFINVKKTILPLNFADNG